LADKTVVKPSDETQTKPPVVEEKELNISEQLFIALQQQER